VCCLPAGRRAKIDTALVDGVTYKKIASRYSTQMQPINTVNLCNHRKHLLPADLVRKAPPPTPEVASTLLQRVESLVAQSRTIAAAAQNGKQWMAATSALREVRCCIELLGKLTGELSSSTNFNFNFLSAGGVLREEHMVAFLDAVEKRGTETIDHFKDLVNKRLGLAAPTIYVEFVAPPPQEAATLPLLLDASVPANGHA
jgi:hypothetical protein